MSDVSRRAQLILLKNDLHVLRGRAERLDFPELVSLLSEAMAVVSSQPELLKTEQPRQCP
jgi:hypothetical protein